MTRVILDEKPVLQGPINGNIFAVMSACSKALKRSGLRDKAKDLTKRVTTQAQDYDHALRICMEYVEFKI